MTSFLSERKAVPKEKGTKNVRIAIAADHGGFDLKEKIKQYLETNGYSVRDYGTHGSESVDYPDFAKKVAAAVSAKECERGILVCGTGIGMSITANKFPGVYAALCHDEYTAKMSRAHNNSNVLTLGVRTTNEETAIKIVDTWLGTDFEGERHERRIRKIKDVEPKKPKVMRVAVSFLEKDENQMTAESILKKIPRLEAAGVATIQWDLMDGKYNPNNTIKWFTTDVMKDVMRSTRLDSEAHLMVAEPLLFVDKVKEYCSLIIFHIEAGKTSDDVTNTIRKIKSCGRKAGIAIEPETSLDVLDAYLGLVDNILVMTVKTGYAGQQFMDMSDKIVKLNEIRKRRGLNFEIEIDGGINDKTIEIVRAAGCDAVNSASYILNNDYEKAVKTLKGL